MSDLILNSLRRQEQNVDDVSSNDPASSITEEEKQRILQELEDARKTDSKSIEQSEVEQVSWSSEDSLAAAQRFFSSMALGWGDEMGLWTSAVINAMPVVGTYAQYGIDTTVREQYDKLRSEYDAKQEAFKERQAGAAIAADVAGSIASPVNLLRTPALAARAVAPTTRTGKAVEAVRQATPITARVAAESAVYGAGEAKEGERLEGAQTGAGMGLVGYGVLRGGLGLGGKTVDVFTRRKVEGDLVDEAGDFVPITLAASKPDGVEGAVHTFYRDIVAPSFGGKGVVKAQEQKIVAKAEEFLDAQKEMSKKMDEGLKARIKDQENAMKDAADALKNDAKRLKDAKNKESASTITPLKEKLSLLKSGKADEIAAKATSDVKRMLNARRFDFRNQAFSNAMPATATVSDIQKILSVEDIGQRMRALDELWSNKGYSMIKGKKIRVKKNEFEKALADGISSDPVFKALITDLPGFQKNVINAINGVKTFKDASGRIDGDILSAIRGRLGTIAANAGDPLLRKSYYMAQGKIDDIIKKQLTDKQLKAFEKEAGNWKSTVVLRDAVESTRTDATKRGVFNESDWITAASKNNNLDKRYGTGPLVGQAHVLEQNLRSAEKAIAKRATNLAKSRAMVVEKTIKEHSDKLQTQLKNIDADIASKKAKLRTNPQFAEDIARQTTLKNAKEAEVKQLKSQLDELKRLRSPQNPSWFHTLAATGILASVATAGGAIVGGPAGAGLGLIAGAGIGRSMATPAVQRTIAGQTAPQMATQRFLQADATGRTADILSRSIGRTGMLTGGQQ